MASGAWGTPITNLLLAANYPGLTGLEPYLSVTQNAINGVGGPNVVFQGANVTVRSTSSLGDGSGTGNLIVGWDDLPNGPLPSPFRNGDNNLVCGDLNNFTTYGCFVAGGRNTVSGAQSSVTGGGDNVASGAISSVSGGVRNQATGQAANVSAGNSNVAAGENAMVCGGWSNQAESLDATIGGGYNLTLNSSQDGAWQAGTLTWP